MTAVSGARLGADSLMSITDCVWGDIQKRVSQQQGNMSAGMRNTLH